MVVNFSYQQSFDIRSTLLKVNNKNNLVDLKNSEPREQH